MSNKQARLVAAISDAMQAQGFSQNNLARVSCVAQSMISAAMLGKYDLKEEKWRMLCEALALDYDDIIAEPEPVPATEETHEPVAEESSVTETTTEATAAPVQQNDAPSCEKAAKKEFSMPRLISLDGGDAGIIAEYLASKLRDDLCNGTLMPIDDIFTLLSHAKHLQKIAEEA